MGICLLTRAVYKFKLEDDLIIITRLFISGILKQIYLVSEQSKISAKKPCCSTSQ